MKHPIPPAELLKRYLAGTCSDTERLVVNEWYQSLDHDVHAAFSTGDEENLYREVRKNINEYEQPDLKPVPTVHFWTYGIRIAAVLCLAVGLVFYFNARQKRSAGVHTAAAQFTRIINHEKRIMRYVLPDSTQVWLSPGAGICYAPSFEKREVNFSGDGFFDVTPDPAKPFVIISGELRTKVLGTSFHVKANVPEHSYEVTVVTGTVEVANVEKNESVVLRPRQQMVFGKQQPALTVKTVSEPARGKEIWQAASLAFEEVPMSDVAKMLSETFRVSIQFENPEIRNCLLKVDFNNQRLSEVLDMIDALLGTTYQMEGDSITISGEGCP